MANYYAPDDGRHTQPVEEMSATDRIASIVAACLAANDGDGFKSAKALVAVAHNLVCDEPEERTAMARLMLAYARELDPDAVPKPRLDG
jgi:hypothetical protein